MHSLLVLNALRHQWNHVNPRIAVDNTLCSTPCGINRILTRAGDVYAISFECSTPGINGILTMDAVGTLMQRYRCSTPAASMESSLA